ncbi:D-cysteine desulfhydrase [Novipirellula aureliae]|uniref:D-cysteine desulfhydrase n=1 Tax=Novipirellula aureliae TaxID=2527966 RepID=A0A5C6DSA5_9BACT|nr:pyridoxal-phosphate dependent enzyme [Novipirellula aureliae]TWU37659.1 D-cysteine desulfhydrase [Novipirellula aureliae]
MKNDEKFTIGWVNAAEKRTHVPTLLKQFGDILPTPLSERVNLDAYADKLINSADIAIANVNGKNVGCIVLYANDTEDWRSYCPLLSVLPTHQGKGIGSSLTSRAISLARQRGMRSMQLETEVDNRSAQKLYRSFGFNNLKSDGHKLLMLKELIDPFASSLMTPIEQHPVLVARLNLDVDLRVKRDDLYPSPGGGSKARKIKYIMRDLIAQGHDVLVTNGGPQSNHARASAVACSLLGIDCHLVLVIEKGVQYKETGNLLLMRMSGATIEFCEKDQLSERMDQAIKSYENKGRSPFYVWGGGHSVAGTIAYVEAAKETQLQCSDWIPDYLVVASGTGTTQAGLTIGYENQPTRIIGISVARDAVRGTQVIHDSIKSYFDHSELDAPHLTVDFRDEWTCGGYEKTNPTLLEIVQQSARSGLIVDPTYSGKALLGMLELIKRRVIRTGSKVLFWHTGGLMNLQASELTGRSVSL